MFIVVTILAVILRVSQNATLVFKFFYSSLPIHDYVPSLSLNVFKA